MSDNAQFPQDMQRVEELIHEIEVAGDPHLRATAIELVQLLMDLHGSGIARMVKLVSQAGQSGSDIIKSFSRDDLVSQLLMLYSLHPVDLETRVEQALDKARPLLKSHGGDVELVSIEDGVVQLRLDGSCNGCPSSAQTLRSTIEEAIYEAAADIAGLKVIGLVQEDTPLSFVPLETLTVS